jgi:hypothetical protein
LGQAAIFGSRSPLLQGFTSSGVFPGREPESDWSEPFVSVGLEFGRRLPDANGGRNLKLVRGDGHGQASLDCGPGAARGFRLNLSG